MASSDSTPTKSQHASDQPLISPPPGVTSNFTNPPNHGRLQIVVTSLLLGVTAVFLLSRIYLKVHIVKKYTWDDCKFMKVLAVSDFNVLKTLFTVTVMLAFVSTDTDFLLHAQWVLRHCTWPHSLAVLRTMLQASLVRSLVQTLSPAVSTGY